jgi:hypothetical protein
LKNKKNEKKIDNFIKKNKIINRNKKNVNLYKILKIFVFFSLFNLINKVEIIYLIERLTKIIY